MKLTKTITSPWRYLNGKMVREVEASILLNYDGHGAEACDTVDELIAKLQRVGPKMRVCVFEDEETGRDGLSLYAEEIRQPTHEEGQVEKNRIAVEREAANLLAEARKRSAPIVLEAQRHAKVEALTRELNPVQLAILQVKSDMGSCADPASLADLQADMETLRNEENRLKQLLQHYEQPVTVSS